MYESGRQPDAGDSPENEDAQVRIDDVLLWNFLKQSEFMAVSPADAGTCDKAGRRSRPW